MKQGHCVEENKSTERGWRDACVFTACLVCLMGLLLVPDPKKWLHPPLKADEIDGAFKLVPRLHVPIMLLHCMVYSLLLNSNSIFGLPGSAMAHGMFSISVSDYSCLSRCYRLTLTPEAPLFTFHSFSNSMAASARAREIKVNIWASGKSHRHVWYVSNLYAVLFTSRMAFPTPEPSFLRFPLFHGRPIKSKLIFELPGNAIVDGVFPIFVSVYSHLSRYPVDSHMHLATLISHFS